MFNDTKNIFYNKHGYNNLDEILDELIIKSQIFDGKVNTFADLPDVATHTDEIWRVITPSGGILSSLGIYKYPAGLYTTNDTDTAWILAPINVRTAEDTLTLVNIDSWSEYINIAINIQRYDIINYKNKIYQNITGSHTTSPPSVDTTNWLSLNTTDKSLLGAINDLNTLKADKIDTAIEDNFASFDDEGNIKDSGVNQGDFEPADPTILREADVIDNLTSTDTNKPLSANQGKVLKENSMFITGGTTMEPSFTNNGDGSITIGDDGIYTLYPTSDFTGYRESYNITGGTFVLSESETNYLVADYNGGSPLIRITTNVLEITESDIIPILTLARQNTDICVLNWNEMGRGLANKIHQRLVKTQRFAKENGLSVSETGTRNVICEPGIVWYGSHYEALDEVNTSLADGSEICLWYHDDGDWTYQTVQQYNNTQYDNGTNLIELTNNRYAVNWVYRNVDATKKRLCIVLGNQNYNQLIDAQNSEQPAIPDIISTTCILIARIIVEKNDNTATEISQITNTTFGGASVNSHNELIGLQGGTAGEYYHLSNDDYINNTTSDNTQTLTNKTIKAADNTLTIASSDLSDASNIALKDVNNNFTTAQSINGSNVLKENDIEDNLSSTSITNPLSANQGRALKSLIDLLQGSLIPQGSWDADTNTPDISGTTTTGYFWIVSVAGSTDLDGITDWKVNDWVVKTSDGWAKVDNTDRVLSVAGKTGTITLEISDITGLQNALDDKVDKTTTVNGQALSSNITLNTDDVNEGTTNKYYSSSLFNSDFALKSTSDLTEGSNLYYTETRVDNNINGKIGDTIQPYDINTVVDANYNTFTTTEKNKLATIENGAEVNTVNSVAGKTGDVILDKTDVGLTNVENVDQTDGSNITSGTVANERLESTVAKSYKTLSELSLVDSFFGTSAGNLQSNLTTITNKVGRGNNVSLLLNSSTEPNLISSLEDYLSVNGYNESNSNYRLIANSVFESETIATKWYLYPNNTTSGSNNGKEYKFMTDTGLTWLNLTNDPTIAKTDEDNNFSTNQTVNGIVSASRFSGSLDASNLDGTVNTNILDESAGKTYYDLSELGFVYSNFSSTDFRQNLELIIEKKGINFKASYSFRLNPSVSSTDLYYRIRLSAESFLSSEGFGTVGLNDAVITIGFSQGNDQYPNKVEIMNNNGYTIYTFILDNGLEPARVAGSHIVPYRNFFSRVNMSTNRVEILPSLNYVDATYTEVKGIIFEHNVEIYKFRFYQDDETDLPVDYTIEFEVNGSIVHTQTITVTNRLEWNSYYVNPSVNISAADSLRMIGSASKQGNTEEEVFLEIVGWEIFTK